MKKIIIAGGTGFLGQALAAHLQAAGYHILILTRSTTSDDRCGARQIIWDGSSIGNWTTELNGAHAIINMAGRSVNCRYHDRNRQLILNSRVAPTLAIGQAIARCSTPPQVWLNASTATIYQHTFGPAWDENGTIASSREAHDSFSVEVARAWEDALNHASTPHTRKVAMRTAMVLGNHKNSVYPILRRLARLGLGGRVSHGRQFVSWIHQTDFCRAVEWLIARDQISGAVNLAAPNPVTNQEMMRLFRENVGMPIGLPASPWMLELGAFLLRTEPELVLKSRRVIPGRLAESGFTFDYPELTAALKDLANPPQRVDPHD